MKIIKLCNFFDYMESFAYKQNITHVLYVTDFSSLYFFLARSWIFEKAFIVNSASVFTYYNVLSTNGQEHIVASNKITGSISTFAVDSNLDIIYFVDSESGSLYKYDIISCQQRLLTSISSAKGKG